MISKISYTKLILYNIKNRGWFFALSCIILFLLMPVYTFMYLDGQDLTGNSPAERSWIISAFPGLLNGGSFAPLSIAVFLLAFLAGASGFAFIHSQEKTDFYHSLPVRRGQWFRISYLSGLVMFLFPYLLCSAISLGVGYSAGAVDSTSLPSCLSAAAGAILAFLLIYNTGILAAVLTGTLTSQIVFFFMLCVYPAIVLTLFTSLKELFYDSFFPGNDSIPDRLAELLSPLVLYDRVVRDTAGKGNPDAVFFCIALLLLFAAAAYLLYRFYPSETAGNALSFPVAAPFFKVLICVPCSMYAGIILCLFTGVYGPDWIFPSCLLIAVLLCGIIEYLYQKDFRLLLRNWRSSLITVGGVLAVLCVMRFDLTGYDSYLPETDELKAVSFTPDSFLSYFSYPVLYTSRDLAENMTAPEEYTKMLHDLARRGIRNLKEGITPDSVNSGSEDAFRYVNTVFQYRTKGGKTISRYYPLSRTDVADALEKLCENEDFRQKMFPVFHLDTEKILAVTLRDITGTDTQLDLTAAQRTELVSAYMQDVLRADISTLNTVSPLGEMLFVIPDTSEEESGTADFSSDVNYTPYSSGTRTIPCFYIYPGYRNTMDCLNEYGLVLPETIPEDEILQLTLFITPDSFRSGKFSALLEELFPNGEYTEEELQNGVIITDPREIHVIIGLLSADARGITGLRYETSDSADITFKNGWSCSYHLQQQPLSTDRGSQ